MKKIIVLTRFIVASLLISTGAIAQDVSINVISQQAGVNDGEWPLDATNTTLLVTICNADLGSAVVPAYKLRPLISVPGAIVQLAPNAEQTGLPAGWSILANNGNSIRLSNGTDSWEPGDCREISLIIKPTAQGGPLTVTATMAFANGVAPGNGTGAQTTGNDPSNDNSTTAIIIGEPMPVTLISFDAAKEGKTANLRWATTEETNSDRFEIEHSVNGKNWSKVGTVASHGESKDLKNYTFSHSNPVNGENLYRLRMVDLDNTFAYSRIRNVKFDGLDSELSLYPNPVSDKLIVRDFNQVTQVEINDLNGRMVHQSGVTATGEISVKNLSAGMYVVKISRSNGVVTAQKIVVAK